MDKKNKTNDMSIMKESGCQLTKLLDNNISVAKNISEKQLGKDNDRIINMKDTELSKLRVERDVFQATVNDKTDALSAMETKMHNMSTMEEDLRQRVKQLEEKVREVETSEKLLFKEK